MIKSETSLGRIYAGPTQLGWSGHFDQTGPNQLTLHGGTYTTVSGEAIAVLDQVFILADGNWCVELDGGAAQVAPAGAGRKILAGFGSGIEVTDGAIVGDIYVLQILPGFPDGNTPAAVDDDLPKWELIKSKLRASDLFTHAFTTNNHNAWALLLATLDSNSPSDDAGRLLNFEMAIAGVRSGLTEDFTAEQLQRFNELLAACHFEFTV